ncbi:MAG: hypothetical protein H6Q39_1142, partial [Chloroflexi bacterium]|nr:hypothetical protein [Chloroflexota bacterium]
RVYGGFAFITFRTRSHHFIGVPILNIADELHSLPVFSGQVNRWHPIHK